MSPPIEIIFVLFYLSQRSAMADDDESITPEQIDLRRIGYNKTWFQFCDPRNAFLEFRHFPGHDLKNLRFLICVLKKQNNVPRLLVTCSIYKYCVSVRPQLDYFFSQFTSKLSQDDDTKKKFLLTPMNRTNETTSCQNEVMAAFYSTCVGRENPCIMMFNRFLSRACIAPWLSTEDIVAHLRKICYGKWVTDQIDWPGIRKSIVYPE